MLCLSIFIKGQSFPKSKTPSFAILEKIWNNPSSYLVYIFRRLDTTIVKKEYFNVEQVRTFCPRFTMTSPVMVEKVARAMLDKVLFIVYNL